MNQLLIVLFSGLLATSATAKSVAHSEQSTGQIAKTKFARAAAAEPEGLKHMKYSKHTGKKTSHMTKGLSKK